MKKVLSLAAVFLCGALAAPAAFADEGGRCHFHGAKPAVETVVRDCASQRKAALVKAGKLDKNWQALAVDKVEQVDGKKGKEWKVTFKDPAAKDKSRETLYMFFTLPGNFIAANFTGL
jgi:hypothetical protein